MRLGACVRGSMTREHVNGQRACTRINSYIGITVMQGFVSVHGGVHGMQCKSDQWAAGRKAASSSETEATRPCGPWERPRPCSTAPWARRGCLAAVTCLAAFSWATTLAGNGAARARYKQCCRSTKRRTRAKRRRRALLHALAVTVLEVKIWRICSSVLVAGVSCSGWPTPRDVRRRPRTHSPAAGRGLAPCVFPAAAASRGSRAAVWAKERPAHELSRLGAVVWHAVPTGPSAARPSFLRLRRAGHRARRRPPSLASTRACPLAAESSGPANAGRHGEAASCAQEADRALVRVRARCLTLTASCATQEGHTNQHTAGSARRPQGCPRQVAS